MTDSLAQSLVDAARRAWQEASTPIQINWNAGVTVSNSNFEDVVVRKTAAAVLEALAGSEQTLDIASLLELAFEVREGRCP